MVSKLLQPAALALFFVAAANAQSGNGITTRYWDCCKQSCSWSGKASVNQPAQTCDASGNILPDPNAASGCDGGSAFTCTDNQPWAVNDTLALGFAAVDIAGGSESSWCCECYALTFTSTAIAGKTMIVQATNTGGDLGSNQFDLLIPGGGEGIFTSGCPAQFGSWNGGATYGGVSSRSDCANLPAAVQAGCYFRFDWFQGVDNPTVSFTQTACPAELIAKSGCQRSGEASTLIGGSTSTPSSPSSSTPPPPSSSSAPSSSSSSSSAPITSSGSSSSCSSAQYGQCAGINYSGCTTCASGSTCTYVNDYYSQCL